MSNWLSQKILCSYYVSHLFTYSSANNVFTNSYSDTTISFTRSIQSIHSFIHKHNLHHNSLQRQFLSPSECVGFVANSMHSADRMHFCSIYLVRTSNILVHRRKTGTKIGYVAIVHFLPRYGYKIRKYRRSGLMSSL